MLKPIKIIERKARQCEVRRRQQVDVECYSSFIREGVNYEISRLKALLRDSQIAEEQRGVAVAMLAFYEDAKSVAEMSQQQAQPRT